MNWLVAALLCALLFTDWRFDLTLPDFSVPELSLAFSGFPTLVALLIAFFIISNWGS
jgi:hypothetical protein